VRDVIGEVGARDLPEIVVFNKSDLIDDDRRLVLRGLEPTALFASARTGEGMPELLERIAELLPQPNVELDLVVPYDRGDLVAFAHARARVLKTSYEEGGTRMRLLADERVAERLRSELATLPQ
jgi:GTP-binding protein HflX